MGMDGLRMGSSYARVSGILLSLAVTVLLAQAPVLGATPLGLIRIGEPFPDVELPRLSDGRPMTLDDFRGKPTLLHIFASW